MRSRDRLRRVIPQIARLVWIVDEIIQLPPSLAFVKTDAMRIGDECAHDGGLGKSESRPAVLEFDEKPVVHLRTIADGWQERFALDAPIRFQSGALNNRRREVYGRGQSLSHKATRPRRVAPNERDIGNALERQRALEEQIEVAK